MPFVGDEACSTCHEEEYAGYQTHGMANSMERVESAELVGPLPSPEIYHAPTNLYYRAFERDGAFFQEEYRLDESGERIHELVRRIDWVVGSGTAARTFLTVDNGLFTEMPLTWYTQREKWDLSPGYDVLNNRFSRAIPDRCMACHNDYPDDVMHVKGRYQMVAEGISCERCHGPGDLHVNERLANPDPASEIDLTIVNPAHLDLDRRLDVCQQCHLNGTVSILRHGRSAYQFRPSEALSSHISLFSESAGEFKVISHAARMMKSACFVATQATAEAMDCTTCHDPHEGFRSAGPGYFDATCQKCHAVQDLAARISPAYAEDHTASSPCASCHMPKEAVNDVPHSSFTDHWIRVVVDSDKETAPSTQGEVELEPYFDRDTDSREGRIYEAVAYFVLGKTRGDVDLITRGVELLKERLTETDSLGDAWYQLGFGLVTLERFEEAEEPLETAVRLGPDIPERLNTLALLYERLGRSPQRIDGLFRHALAVQPAEAAIRVNYGRFLETQGRNAAAEKQYRMAADHQPSLATAQYNLGTVLIKKGEVDEGEERLAKAIQLDPDYEDAHGNLAVVLATQGREDEALFYFQRAVDAAPQDPVALNNLGSFYLNHSEDERSVPLLRRAVENDPEYVDALVNLALALVRVGNDSEALEFANQALGLDPGNQLAAQIRQAVL
jgi:Tfp pilus assembly protein PilF